MLSTYSSPVEYNGTAEDADLRRFYLHIILRAVEEAKGVNLIGDNAREYPNIQRDARAWLIGDCTWNKWNLGDLKFICERAGVDWKCVVEDNRRKYGVPKG